MKKIIILLFLSAIAAVNVLSESNPHDSLLFDGGGNVRTETYYSKSGEDCEFRVTYVKGNATGKIKKMQIFEACGIDTIYEYENGALEKYSVIKGGETVKTGPESSVKIELSDGSSIFLGPNTQYTLPTNVCDLVRSGILGAGSLWTKVKKLIGGGKFEVSTERACACVRGTEYTVEIVEENGKKYDIVKVYEGSVDVILKTIDTKGYEDKGDKLTKLSEDFQSGKISMEEYSAKSLEITQGLQNETSNLKMSQIVEPGYLLKHDGKTLSDPVPFNTSEDTWFKINE
jgi:hypothetical protein